MSVTVVPIPGGRFLRHRILKLVPRYDNCLNFGGEYVKNTSIFAVSVPINLSIKFGFLSVKGPRGTYFLDALCISVKINAIFLHINSNPFLMRGLKYVNLKF